MWETIEHILMSPNATIVLCFVLVIVILGILLSKSGLLNIRTQNFQLGASVRERDIIRSQVDWSHTFIMGLYSQINPKDSKYGGYFTKYILEYLYSEVVNWITFNHIRVDTEYLTTKQSIIRSMIYSMDIDEDFKTPEFQKQVDDWVEEVVKTLVKIRENYK